jgi:hypothetical protein
VVVHELRRAGRVEQPWNSGAVFHVAPSTKTVLVMVVVVAVIAVLVVVVAFSCARSRLRSFLSCFHELQC